MRKLRTPSPAGRNKDAMPHDAVMDLLSRYGYIAVFAGTMIEGETVILVAGFLAHQGYLSLPLVILCAFMGSMVSDQGLFFLSRFKGNALLTRFPGLTGKLGRLSARLDAHPHALYAYALVFRFLYGLRAISPLFLGLGKLPASAFVLLNAVGAALWAAVFSSIGFFFARTLQTAVGPLKRYEGGILAALVLAGAAVAIFLYRRRAKRSAADTP